MIPKRYRVVSGTRNFAALNDFLADLRRRLGLEHDLSTDAHHLFSLNDRRRRRPLLVIAEDSHGQPEAATLFFERLIFGIPTGVLRAGDHAGDGAVIAAPDRRAAAFRDAVEFLQTSRRCHTVFGAVPLQGHFQLEHSVYQAVEGVAVRTLNRRLRLAGDYASLVSGFRKGMRRAIRQKRKHFDERHDAEFLPAMSAEFAREAITSLTERSAFPRSNWEILNRYEFLKANPESFSMGLRLKSGQWLSYISGWRTEGVTYISWVMHNAGFSKESLSTVMNSYVFEEEIRRDQRWIQWIGGITERWSALCEPEQCLCITRSRQCLQSLCTRWLAARLKLNTALEYYADELARMSEDSDLKEDDNTLVSTPQINAVSPVWRDRRAV